MRGADLRVLVESLGAEGFASRVNELLNAGTVAVEDFSYLELRRACEGVHVRESSPGVGTALFPIVTGELIGRQVMAGYEDDAGWIGDRLVTVVPTMTRNNRLAGFLSLQGAHEVAEGHPYEESTFGEKYVTTKETKNGRVLSINEELIAFDQTGEINRRARALGYWVRQSRERTIVRGVTGADTTYRPSGTAETLYATDGSNYNWIGSGNTTSASFNAAVPLVDWTDVQFARRYRATAVLDDRVGETARPIMLPTRQLLVPEALSDKALRIASATEVRQTDGADATTVSANPLPKLEVLSSPFIDEQGGQAVNDWFLGDSPRGFVWSEVWPVQTFLQSADSEAGFDRDVALRVKVRYFGGIACTDPVFLSKVDGA